MNPETLRGDCSLSTDHVSARLTRYTRPRFGHTSLCFVPRERMLGRPPGRVVGLLKRLFSVRIPGKGNPAERTVDGGHIAGRSVVLEDRSQVRNTGDGLPFGNRRAARSDEEGMCAGLWSVHSEKHHQDFVRRTALQVGK